MIRSLYKLIEIPGVYDAVQEVLGGKRYRALLKRAVGQHLSVESHAQVLDVGCGTGIITAWIAGAYHGIDINPQYVQKVAEAGKGFFYVADATALPFRSHQFDQVCTIGVLHHLHPDLWGKMLAEMIRVCKHEGYVLIFDGLVPKNRLNILGYALAKLDRGRYKMRLTQFRAVLTRALPPAARMTYEVYPMFPSEYVACVITVSDQEHNDGGTLEQ